MHQKAWSWDPEAYSDNQQGHRRQTQHSAMKGNEPRDPKASRMHQHATRRRKKLKLEAELPDGHHQTFTYIMVAFAIVKIMIPLKFGNHGCYGSDPLLWK
jgi:hypothetical protein